MFLSSVLNVHTLSNVPMFHQAVVLLSVQMFVVETLQRNGHTEMDCHDCKVKITTLRLRAFGIWVGRTIVSNTD